MRYGEWIGRGALAVIFPLNGLGIVAFWAYHGPELRGRLVNVPKRRDVRRPLPRRLP